MFGMNVMAWNGRNLKKLEVLLNRVWRFALGAPKWTAVEGIRGDLGGRNRGNIINKRKKSTNLQTWGYMD
ncbi:hypothetical protein FHG87_022658 [Trinorchestia longiramus]|nr:hypothetical protein FHG87_022658 [Trinorchestia longiramus]